MPLKTISDYFRQAWDWLSYQLLCVFWFLGELVLLWLLFSFFAYIGNHPFRPGGF